MPMTLEQIEAEVLKLPQQAQEELLGRLMRSLANTSAMGSERGRSVGAGGSTSR